MDQFVTWSKPSSTTAKSTLDPPVASPATPAICSTLKATLADRTLWGATVGGLQTLIVSPVTAPLFTKITTLLRTSSTLWVKIPQGLSVSDPMCYVLRDLTTSAGQFKLIIAPFWKRSTSAGNAIWVFIWI